jgi:beta-galactosidase
LPGKPAEHFLKHQTMSIVHLIFTFILYAFLVLKPSKTYIPPGSHRVSKIINSQWTFNYFPAKDADKGFESPLLKDNDWPAISIPHTWSTYETTGELHPYIRNAAESDNPYWWNGWGWYRKHFSVNNNPSGKKVFIEFEGVMKYCKVWINGTYLGDHKGGYGSFDFDLTPYIKPGEDNLLTVAVNNLRNDQFSTPPMAAGNFNVYGGIYRDVTIVLKDKLYIPMQGSAAHEGGTFVTTPVVTGKQGIVRVQTWVKNDYDQTKNCTLRTIIADNGNNIVQEIVSKASIKPGELYRFDQLSKPIKNPRLWSNDDPYLYKVYSEVTDGKILTDNYESPLGFRWFKWDYNENFLYVNGKKMIVHGGNRHQEYPWLGDAIPKWITEMDFNDIAVNLNYNFMRTAHYPNDKAVYDLTDKYGIVIDEESPSIKNQPFSPEVQEQQMKEMIRRDRNHPSIMLWGMGNETNHAVDSRFAVEEDTTRILTARRVTDGSAGDFVKHTDENLALENLLRCTIRGWYNSDVKNLSPTDPQHAGTEEHQQNMLIASQRFGTGNLCTWLYEDHGADREYLNAPLLHVNPKGYVDSYRFPKYAYFFWQANYSRKPMIFILPHFWRSQYLDQKKDINIDSNCDTVELFVNGKSMGQRFPCDSNFHNVTFKDILIRQGTISAAGKLKGVTFSTKVEMAGEPARIALTSSHSKITADRASVVIVKADITDASGNHIYGAANTIKWNVTGPATLVGPSIYESDIDKHHSMEGTMYTDMPVANVIRSTGEPGTIKVTASSSGLATAGIVISAEEVNRDYSIIAEPVLKNEGRVRVAVNSVPAANLPEIPKEIGWARGDFGIDPEYKGSFENILAIYILSNNRNTDSSTIEFKALTGLFSTHLKHNNGKLIADDYNFSADHYNKCRYLSRSVDNTALPEVFRNGIKRYYANSIITQGMEKDINREKEWLMSIPAEGNIVFVKDKNAKSVNEGGVMTIETELDRIIGIILPGFGQLSDESKEKAMAFIASVNPYITTTLRSEVVNNKKVTRAFYKVDSGEPIWIPTLKEIFK